MKVVDPITCVLREKIERKGECKTWREKERERGKERERERERRERIKYSIFL